MRSIVIPLLMGLRSSLRSQAELQVEIIALHHQPAVLQREARTESIRIRGCWIGGPDSRL